MMRHDLLDHIKVPTVDPVSIIEHAEEQERADKRQLRIDTCGSWRHRCDPNTGGYKSFQIKCGYWRECPDCFEVRVLKFELRYAACLNQCDVRVVEAGKSLIRKLRRLGVEYWAIPTEDGLVVVYEDVGDLGGEVVIPDWTILAHTPENRRYSGDLGKPEVVPEEVSVRITIPVRQVAITPGKVPVAAMIAEADRLTNDLDPDLDEEELRYAVWTKSQVLREVVYKRGGEITSEDIVLVTVTDKTYRRWIDRNKVTKMPAVNPLKIPDLMQMAFWSE